MIKEKANMRTFKMSIMVILITSLLSLAYTATCLAETASPEQTDTIKFVFHSNTEITKATAYIIPDPQEGNSSRASSVNKANGKRIITRPAQLEYTGKNSWTASVPIYRGEKTQNSNVTVIAISKDGKIIPSAVKFLKPPKYRNPDSIKCMNTFLKVESPKIYSLNEDALLELLKVRREKNNILRAQLKNLLTTKLGKLIKAKEEEIGINSQSKITQNTSLRELAKRLILITAVNPY